MDRIFVAKVLEGLKSSTSPLVRFSKSLKPRVQISQAGRDSKAGAAPDSLKLKTGISPNMYDGVRLFWL